MPVSSRSSQQQLEDLGLDGDVERRGRLVGDQQAAARQASAMAIMTRWRMPPLKLVRIAVEPALPASGCRPAPAARSRVAPRLAAARARGAAQPSRRSARRWCMTGLSAVIGSWKIMRDPAAAQARAARLGGMASRSRPSNAMPAALDAAGAWRRPSMAAAGHGLATTDLADDAERLAGARLEARRRRRRRRARGGSSNATLRFSTSRSGALALMLASASRIVEPRRSG